MSTTPNGVSDRIIWIDCEMTGLNLDQDALVEIAAVVTDGELNVLGEGVEVVIKPPAGALEQMGDFVRSMHTESGLINRLEHGVSLGEAEQIVIDYIKAHVPVPARAPLAGNSVATDKMFLERDMKELVQLMHYRIVDVSSIKELARRWYPRIYYASPTKNGGHRALADILESIDELRYYRSAMFVAQPGPSTQEARNKSIAVVDSSVSQTVTVPQAFRKTATN